MKKRQKKANTRQRTKSYLAKNDDDFNFGFSLIPENVIHKCRARISKRKKVI